MINAEMKRALQLPSGAVFHRCALQVNPHHYSATFRGQTISGDEAEHARSLIANAVELKITVLGITDHNSVTAVPFIRKEARQVGIEVFPGFELSSCEGVHVLCLYPPQIDQGQLERFLGEFGIRDTAPSSTLSDKTFGAILALVRGQGGATIAAHVTNDKGLFRSLGGQARAAAWRDPGLLAIQIPGSVADLPQDIREIVENKNPDYKRSHATGERLAVAVVNASDVVQASDLEQPSATCWIKMSEVSIDGLRQAFLDPDSRISLGAVDAQGHAEILAIAWQGGFLDGAAIHCNSNLNVLVGGRGTGKSTVIESVRAVMGLMPIGDEAGRAFEGIVKHVLRSGTKISLLVRSHRPAPRQYLVERTIPNPPIVRDESGEVLKLQPHDILPRIEIYGQHEISELANSRDRRTRLLARFVEGDDNVAERKASLRRELERNRRSLLETAQESATVGDRLAALPGLEETLNRFRDAGVEDLLKDQSFVVREERVLSSIPERLRTFRECLESLRRELPIDKAFLSPKALDELPAKNILARATEVLDVLESDLRRVADSLDQSLRRADTGLSTIKQEWEDRRTKSQIAYEKILRHLQKSKVDGEEYIRLRRHIEELSPLRERDSLLRRLEKEQSDRRRALLADWENLKGEEFRSLDRAAKKANRALNNRVLVEVTAGGNREPLFKLLKEKVGGRLAEAIDQLSRMNALSLTSFVENCRAGRAALIKAYGFPQGVAERLAGISEDVLMQIEELELPPTTVLRLNTSSVDSPAEWKTLEELSTGQKATAVLLLLLLESDAPLIVDQPEDDLDNRFIAEGVVPRMREAKRKRQFLFSTHNANIPVLGDAELILGLVASGDAEGGHGRIPVESMGSIDGAAVRDLVEEILEGGREAFEMRRLKYGF